MNRPPIYAVSALSLWLASILFYLASGEPEQAINILSFGGLTFLVVAIFFGNEIFVGPQIEEQDARRREKFAERIAAFSSRFQASHSDAASRRTKYHAKRSVAWHAVLCVAVCIANIVGMMCGLLLSDHANMAALVGGAGIFGVIGGSLMGMMHGRH